MTWQRTWRADPRAAALADDHYSRKSRGADQFAPPVYHLAPELHPDAEPAPLAPRYSGQLALS